MYSTILITITEGQQEPYVINLLKFKKNVIKFGSRQDCDIVLKMNCVLEIHGIFELNQDGTISVDAFNTDAGIYSGENKIIHKNLHNGDEVCIKGENINENPYDCVKISVSIIQSQNMHPINSNANLQNNMQNQIYGDNSQWGYTQNQSNNTKDYYTPKEYSGASIASMILGIVALLTSCCLYPLSIICSIIAIYLFVTSDKYKLGKGMGIAGLVCAIIAILPALYGLIMGVAVMDFLSELGNMY